MARRRKVIHGFYVVTPTPVGAFRNGSTLWPPTLFVLFSKWSYSDLLSCHLSYCIRAAIETSVQALSHPWGNRKTRAPDSSLAETLFIKSAFEGALKFRRMDIDCGRSQQAHENKDAEARCI